MSLYDELGGEPRVAAIADDFYARIVADDLLGAWFTAADHDGIRFHLRAYLSVALGGPEAYNGRSMRRAHAGLHITGTAFDTVLVRLADALAAASVRPPLVSEVVAVVGTLRPVVVQVAR